ncbi:piggyBac transposable element-derived protein 4-like [Ischnura elegans]|uniref:piggyBac transposable element-derived protein 4-like n=1 Tax=Ischnura elegans TaxID=197161 RepID=UPI001ED892DC|nr:piggyBac transposable element-derived protein 4-like [Ischnura elegans]
MSRKRFHFILQSLRFDDKATRSDRKLLDKLAPVREVFDIFVQNCRESYSLGEYVTIDEMLSKFRGRCAFRQYIPSKPGKYGIKIFSLADSKTFYTGNLEVYVGKQPEGPFYVSNSANDVVKRLVRPIAHSGRNITADNWFTSYELVLDLLKANLTYVGTVRKNKRQLPPSFTSPVGREPFTTRFGFDRHCTLVSYIPKPRKNVILISSMHHDSTIDETTGNSNKPEIVTFYNATKSGVDVVDKLCATYSVARNTKRWPMTIFYTMLNVAAINAQVIYLVNNKESSHAILKRRHFIKVLAQELTKEHLQKRSHVVNLPRELRKRTLAISEKDKETEHNESSTGTQAGLPPLIECHQPVPPTPRPYGGPPPGGLPTVPVAYSRGVCLLIFIEVVLILTRSGESPSFHPFYFVRAHSRAGRIADPSSGSTHSELRPEMGLDEC